MANENFYREGFKITIANSQALLKTADFAAKEKEYGIACALNILSAEEAIKAVLLLAKHYDLAKDIPNFGKMFRDHTIKHEHLKTVFRIKQVFLNHIIKEYGHTIEIFEKVESLPKLSQEAFKKKFGFFYSIMDKIKTILNEGINENDSNEWWDIANKEKNKGFYVDNINSSWHNPKETPVEKYNSAKKHTKSIINYSLLLDDLMNSQSINKKIKKEQDNRNEVL